ncbi:HesB/IscA family protein [Thermocoleostomius sinensis]|uniref:Iron-sulfur cluster assembly accessory protein n=1 Tax=Thermocoleostomius sinensis A174 TaxID=2016057 RepID=A0A9E9CBD3_9CYAN|nr:iron-sulfur cluster assembly accessory protein [Thermocoleostomius sinensis]WAL60350.1 iron-sulfur cluster assembly accessory protein [Thermocoleostomius sinensis A174]
MIHLSPAAIAEVHRIQSKATHPNIAVRLSVKSGGCADFYYALELDDAIATADYIQTCDGLQIVVDADSLPYVDGLKIDYTEDLMGGGFRFDNPNAVSNCGCGNSFSVNSA